MKQKHRPWGAVAGLLAGSLTTLVGAACLLDPDVIALRAVAAALAVGAPVALIVGLARLRFDPS